MSKSIYDEALEELKDHNEGFSFDYNKVVGALQKAQKQEKLLELYKRLYTMELSQLSLNSNYYEMVIIKLKQQIKELENDK